MIKIKVNPNDITILGHAMYDDYGKDIVCAAVSSTVITVVESIAAFNKEAIDVEESSNKLVIRINLHDETTNTLIKTMLNLLSNLEKQYPENIKITNKEE